jgi:superfamily II DNA/RNA helicase
VGLNLQAASAVVNFEPPWNPARLEQRIGRVHRLGQSRSVHVIHLLTTGSIEERVWETLQRKKSLFAGVFDSPAAEVSFAALGRKSVLEAVKEVFADQPERPKPAIDQAPTKPVPVKAAAAAAPPDTLGEAAAGLLEAGIKFLESITSAIPGAPSRAASDHPLRRVLSGLISRDPGTNRPMLSIPLPESVTEGRLTNALAGLLSRLR